MSSGTNALKSTTRGEAFDAEPGFHRNPSSLYPFAPAGHRSAWRSEAGTMCLMRMTPAMFAVAVLGSLLAVLGLSRGMGVPVINGGHAHVHVHHHGGSSHHHVHTHPASETERGDLPDPATPGPVNGAGCSPEPDDHRHCCHDHHHGDGSSDEALPGRSRDSIPTPAAIADSADSARPWALPQSHDQRWPYARGRPPDHLIHLRTVVLLT